MKEANQQKATAGCTESANQESRIKNQEPAPCSLTPPSILLVTGGAGYIGSQFIRDIVTDPRFTNTTIRIYDSLQRQHLCGLMDLPSHGCYEFIEGDILDRFNLGRAMQGVSTVIHMAAIVSTPLSFDHPEWTEQVNHWGTASVVDCALNAGVSRLIYVSSSSVYGPGGPFKETANCHPIGPYAISKRKGEVEVLEAHKRGLNPTIIRLGTTFGNAPAMRFDAIANRLAFLVGVGRPMVIHGSGQQIRPLIHVHDASAVLRFCLTDPQTEGEIINAAILTPTANTIADTLHRLVPTATVLYTDQDILTEISFDIDSSKLLAMGFVPQFDLEKGLAQMLVRWSGFRAVPTNGTLLEE
ncbi:MAG: NAD(P)-dependent oxidoreductase [Anaerolineae bacterium]|nr:NAD(P)-dependent oxidoreductase [Anaerolineae bacterium]